MILVGNHSCSRNLVEKKAALVLTEIPKYNNISPNTRAIIFFISEILLQGGQLFKGQLALLWINLKFKENFSNSLFMNLGISSGSIGVFIFQVSK